MVNLQTTSIFWGELPGFPFSLVDMTPVLVGETPVARGMAEEMNRQANLAALEREAMQMNIQLNLNPKGGKKKGDEPEKSKKEKQEEGIKKGILPYYVVIDGREEENRHRAEIEKLEKLAEQGS